MTLPPAIIPAADILVTTAELMEDGTIPYACLDELRHKHHIDVTALSWSSTGRGHAYRQYVLLMRDV